MPLLMRWQDALPLLYLILGCYAAVIVLHFFTLWRSRQDRKKQPVPSPRPPPVRQPAKLYPFDGTFRYFAHPHRFSTWSPTPQECSLCGESQPGYTGPFYGEADLEWICEICLGQGRLAELGLFANTAWNGLSDQLRALHPELLDEEIRQLAQERSREVEERTPRLLTWQDSVGFPPHCGDYMRFEYEAGQADLNALDAEGDGKRFLTQHLLPRSASDIDMKFLWERLQPASTLEQENRSAAIVYVFQCLHCGERILQWDIN